MPKAYAVVTYRSVSDPEKLAAYAELALPAVISLGPASLLGATQCSPRAGLKKRTVIIEFRAWEGYCCRR